MPTHTYSAAEIPKYLKALTVRFGTLLSTIGEKPPQPKSKFFALKAQRRDVWNGAAAERAESRCFEMGPIAKDLCDGGLNYQSNCSECSS